MEHTFDEEELTFAGAGWTSAGIVNCIVQKCGIPGKINTRIELVKKSSSGKKLDETVLIEFSNIIEIPLKLSLLTQGSNHYLSLTFPETGFKVLGSAFETGSSVIIQLTNGEVVDSWVYQDFNQLYLSGREDRIYVGANTIDSRVIVFELKSNQTKLELSGEQVLLTGLVAKPDLTALGQYQGKIYMDEELVIENDRISSWYCLVDSDPEVDDLLDIPEEQMFAVTGATVKDGQLIVSALVKDFVYQNQVFDGYIVGRLDSGQFQWSRGYQSTTPPRLAPSVAGVLVGLDFKGKLISGQEVLATGSGVCDYYLQEITIDNQTTSLNKVLYCVHPNASFIGSGVVGVTKRSYEDCFGLFIATDEL